MSMSAPNKHTHPADGLYGLSREILENQLACDEHMEVWLENNGENLVPVTLENLAAHITQTRDKTSAALFLIKRMYYRDFITLDERNNAQDSDCRRDRSRGTDNIFNATPLQQARRVMDLLWIRAQRENHPALRNRKGHYAVGDRVNGKTDFGWTMTGTVTKLEGNLVYVQWEHGEYNLPYLGGHLKKDLRHEVKK